MRTSVRMISATVSQCSSASRTPTLGDFVLTCLLVPGDLLKCFWHLADVGLASGPVKQVERELDRSIGGVKEYDAAQRVGKPEACRGESDRQADLFAEREHDDRLRYAAAAVPGLTILTYNVTFRLAPMPDLAGQ
jgi:hypothetical protein